MDNYKDTQNIKPHSWHSETMEAMKSKDDAALYYIIQDCREAARRLWDIAPIKAGYYEDEAHYAGMEIARRRNLGRL